MLQPYFRKKDLIDWTHRNGDLVKNFQDLVALVDQTAQDVVALPGKNIKIFDTIAQLQAYTPTVAERGFSFLVRGYYSRTDGAGGPAFVWQYGAAPGTYVNDGAWKIVPTGGDGSSAYTRDTGITLTVKEMGLRGDGATDDLARLIVIDSWSIQKELHFSPGVYLLSGTFSCHNHLVFDIGASIKLADTFAANTVGVDVVTPGCNLYGLSMSGNATLLANGVVGFALSGYSHLAQNCVVGGFKYGAVLRTYIIHLDNCTIINNDTNVAIYATSTSKGSNDIKITGGNYRGGVTYSFNIGDPGFATTVPLNASFYHGASILLSGFACDGAEMRIDRHYGVEVSNVYFEAPGSSKCITAGQLGDGSQAGLLIRKNYFRSAQFAVYLVNAVKFIEMIDCDYSAITMSALWSPSDIYPTVYRGGNATGSFAQGKEYHTGFRRGLSTINFLNHVNQRSSSMGSQLAMTSGEPSEALPNALFSNSGDGLASISTRSGRSYLAPFSGAGTKTSYQIVMTNPADAKNYNGGDYVSFGGTTTYVANVDYVNGIVEVNDNAVTGAVTLAQQANQWKAVLGDTSIRKRVTQSVTSGQYLRLLTIPYFSSMVFYGTIDVSYSGGGAVGTLKLWLNLCGSALNQSKLAQLGLFTDVGSAPTQAVWSWDGTNLYLDLLMASTGSTNVEAFLSSSGTWDSSIMTIQAEATLPGGTGNVPRTLVNGGINANSIQTTDQTFTGSISGNTTDTIAALNVGVPCRVHINRSVTGTPTYTLKVPAAGTYSVIGTLKESTNVNILGEAGINNGGDTLVTFTGTNGSTIKGSFEIIKLT